LLAKRGSEQASGDERTRGERKDNSVGFREIDIAGEGNDRDMVVCECEGDGVRRVAIHECEGARIGVLFACARNGGMNNNNNVNFCARKGKGAGVVVCGARKSGRACRR
jgi:hypothetical protein